MITINNVDLEIDMLDANEAEKFDKVMDNTKNSITKAKGVAGSKGIRILCEVVFNAFDDIFGEGTHKKIFGEKVNALSCLKAFQELVDGVQIQSDEAVKSLDIKYSANRAKRRSKK